MEKEPKIPTQEEMRELRESALWLKADTRKIKVVCSNSSHKENEILGEFIVQYVKGRAKPPVIVSAEWVEMDSNSGDIPLIRNQPLRGDPYEFTPRNQSHLAKTGQWRNKVNWKCTCGENLPIKSIQNFEELLRPALENDLPEVSLNYLRKALSSQKKRDTPK